MDKILQKIVWCKAQETFLDSYKLIPPRDGSTDFSQNNRRPQVVKYFLNVLMLQTIDLCGPLGSTTQTVQNPSTITS